MMKNNDSLSSFISCGCSGQLADLKPRSQRTGSILSSICADWQIASISDRTTENLTVNYSSRSRDISSLQVLKIDGCISSSIPVLGLDARLRICLHGFRTGALVLLLCRL